MEIMAKPFDAEHHATELVRNKDYLTWKAHGNTHTLMLRASFGDALELDEQMMGTLQEAASNNTQALLSGSAVPLRGDVTAQLIQRKPVPIFSCAIPQAHASYAVFACEVNTQSSAITVYVPNAACKFHCDVPAKVSVSISRHTAMVRTGGWFSKTVEQTVGWVMQISPIVGYDGSGLSYGFDGLDFRYPITRDMLGKPLHIAAYTNAGGAQPAPKLLSTENGYEISPQMR